MSAESVGGDEISVFSPVGMARAAAIPVGALEAGDLMGETPRGKKARYAEPAEQTPDHKAEEIVKKTFWLESGKDDARGPEKGCIQVLQTHQRSDPHEREIPEPCTESPANSKTERASWSQTVCDSRIRRA